MDNDRKTVIVPRLRSPAWHGDRTSKPATYEVSDVESALRGQYDGEACLTTYAPVDDSKEFPRLGKAALAYFAASDNDPEPHVQVVPVDIDYADHEVPPDNWHHDVLDKVEWPCGWYRTPHGLRLVFYPHETIPLSKGESYIAWLHRHLHEWGVEPDEATTSWVRLFKLPHALRRDLPFDYSDLEPIDAHPDDLDTQQATSVGPIVDYDGPPSPDKSISKTYLSPLNDQHLREKLADGRLRARKGQRHDTFLQTACQIVAQFDTDDPEVPYEILYESWDNFDDKRPAELWRIAEWATAQYQGAKRDRKEERTDAKARAADSMGVDEDEVDQRVIIDTGSEQFIWDEAQCRYSEGLTHKHQLLGGLRRHAPRLAAEPISERWSREEVMAYYSSIANRVVFTYADDGGYDEATRTLYRRVCRRDPRLVATKHPSVEEWIESFDADGKLKKWLAAAPRLDRPTCGLYIQGPPSIGKQLLALGLARIWSPESAVTPYAEMVGDWNASLKQSPIIWADEKVPHDAFKTNDSSVLRQIIGNDSIRIREKHRTAATLRGYPRVLITANNDDALAIREELSDTDLEAIRVRLGYIATDESPKRKLEQLASDAGFQSTREYTDDWVAGGKLAEYILWLEDNYDYDPDDRLLVEGWTSELTRDLPTRVGSAGDLGEKIAHAIVTDVAAKSIRWRDGFVYVNSLGLEEDWHRISPGSSQSIPSSKKRSSALGTLADKQVRLRDSDGNRQRYWKIPAENIARIAERRGVCTKDRLIEECDRSEEPEKASVLEMGT